MHNRTIRIGLMVSVLVGAAALTSDSCRSQTPAPQAPQAVPILFPRTQLLTMTSSIDGQEYKIDVALPFGYADGSKSYPTLYLLDAQQDFPFVAGMLMGLTEDNIVPPIVLVGITWGGENPNYGQVRMKDMTPTKSKANPQTGNAPNFLKFIKQQLVPFIDSTYRTTKDDRGLMGHSAGGLFTLYALLHEPALFNHYIIASPNLNYDLQSTQTDEQSLADQKPQISARIFMSIGELEGAGKAGLLEDFAQRLKAKKYSGLELETAIISDSGHSSSRAESYLRGLRTVYAQKSVAVPVAVLDEYAGKYQGPPGHPIEILREHDKLTFITPEGSRLPLNALSQTDFAIRGIYRIIHFSRNKEGQVTGYESESWTGRQFTEKIQ